ncbi:hypothetical protein [Sinorhizobium fredii]|uniref:hypothetical protein n=1 Tax=Rhizobium fredii TaxID=380 RepID=UPI0004AE6971|nr:hypothetical protein [Sinorhizobium fredii]
MNELISAPIPAENILSDKFRIHPVLSDSMEPTLRGGRDYVLLAPVSQYVGEGVYAIVDVLGVPDLFRVTPEFGKGLRLFRDNKRYLEHVVSLEQFEEAVVAFMVAEIKVKDERFLREARNG